MSPRPTTGSTHDQETVARDAAVTSAWASVSAEALIPTSDFAGDADEFIEGAIDADELLRRAIDRHRQ